MMIRVGSIVRDAPVLHNVCKPVASSAIPVPLRPCSLRPSSVFASLREPLSAFARSHV